MFSQLTLRPPESVWQIACCFEGIQDSAHDRAVSQAEIPRVFFQENRIEEVCEKAAGNLIGKGGSVALGIACRSLSICGEFVVRLAKSCLYPHQRKFDRIEGRFGEQVKLSRRTERRSMCPASRPKIRKYAQYPLRLFLFLNLLFLFGF